MVGFVHAGGPGEKSFHVGITGSSKVKQYDKFSAFRGKLRGLVKIKRHGTLSHAVCADQYWVMCPYQEMGILNILE